MCHYHSISVNRQGTIAHVASNSHSEAVEEAGWKKNTAIKTYYWNFEYNPHKVEFPGSFFLLIGTGYTTFPTRKVCDSADEHYHKLLKLYARGIKDSTCYPLLDYFSGDNYFDVRRDLADVSYAHPIIFTKLSEDENLDILCAVAANSYCPIEILTKLSKNKAWEVRYCVAVNPSTHPEILAKLSEDKNPNVRQATINAPNYCEYLSFTDYLNLPNQVKVELLNPDDTDWNTMPVHIIQWAFNLRNKDPNLDLRIACSTNAPYGILEKLSNHPMWMIRRAVLYHSNTPYGTILELSEDEDKGIRQEAQKILSIRNSVNV